jgi:hypothetical protein
MKARPIGALLLALGVAAEPVWADEPSAVAAPAPGSRVRFDTRVEGRRTATVVEAGGEALVVRLAGKETVVRVALADMTSLEVSTGRRTRAREGAIVGFVPGAFFGGLFGVYAGCYETSDCYWAPYAALGAFIVGSLTGLVGAAIGALFKTDRWEPVSTPRAQLRLAPTGQGGVAIGLKVSF